MEDCQTPTSKKSNIEICDIYDIYGNRTGKLSFAGNHCQMDSLSWLSMYGLSTAKMKF